MKDKLRLYLQAGYAALDIISPEGQRVEAEVAAAAAAAGFTFYSWSVTRGLFKVKPAKGDKPAEITPVPAINADSPQWYDVLDNFDKLPKSEKSVVLLHDYHMHLAQPDPMLSRKIKDSILNGKMCSHTMIIVGCQLVLPPELEKEITVLPFSLPDRDQLLSVAQNIAKSVGVELNGNTDELLDAASGLTTIEAEDAMSLAAVESKGKDIPPEIVAREKAGTIKKGGILEIIESKLTLSDIGGLELYKEHLTTISRCFTKAAKDYGLPSPRPIIACGQAGTAKSMSAMTLGNVFNLPLLRIEAGSLFGSLVGESERNWRTTFATVRAIAPAIVWIDEAEALFTGMQSSGRSDGGTTSRVIKAILQDMQFHGEGIFFMFTSNDIDQFPDPLIDRCDVWSFELPTLTERKAIWAIHITKRGRKAKKYDCSMLAEKTEGYSGRQIEQIWIKAMMLAFNDGGREPTEDDVLHALSGFVATSVTMAEAITRRRIRLANRARPASKPEPVAEVRQQRKLVQQEQE